MHAAVGISIQVEQADAIIVQDRNKLRLPSLYVGDLSSKVQLCCS